MTRPGVSVMARRFGRTIPALLLAACVIGGWTRSARAVTVKTLHIIGKDDDSGVDARIPAAVRAALKRTFHFKSYALAGSAARGAAMGQTVRIALPGGHVLVVKPISATGEGTARRITLEVAVFKGSSRIVAVTVRLKPGRYWLLGGPPVDGGTLIVAIAVVE